MTEIFSQTRTYSNGMEFRQEELENYYIDYIETPRKSHLIIVFDGAQVDEDEQPWRRHPWGAMFFNHEGFSLVGVKVKTPDWYRGADLHQFFRSDAFQTFIKRYDKVCLYGNSMGGYAALAFAGAIEGCRVLSSGPQSTMDPRLVPWDDRFPVAMEQNWDGDFADAAHTLDNVEAAYVLYDPFYDIDRNHVKRLPQDKIVHLKAPFLVHDLAPQLLEMDLLGPLFLHFIEGDLETWFPKSIRARKYTKSYEYHALLLWALRYYQRGANDNAVSAAQELLNRNPGDHFASVILQGMKNGEPIEWKWEG